MKVKYCPKCKEYYGGGVFNIPESNKCFYCKQPLTTELNIEKEEFNVLYKISSDDTFLQAMIKLKESDPIEYQLKLSQFKANTSTQEQNKKQADNLPKCPTCNSTNIEKISIGKKAVGGFMFGLFSSDVRKTMHCKNCGYKW